MPQPEPGTPIRPINYTRDGTFLMTAEQHFEAAQRLLKQAEQPGAHDPEWARRIARDHQVIAQVIAHRQKTTGAASPAAPTS